MAFKLFATDLDGTLLDRSGAPGYFRLSYCIEDWTLEGAVAGFRAAARELGLPG